MSDYANRKAITKKFLILEKISLVD